MEIPQGHPPEMANEPQVGWLGSSLSSGLPADQNTWPEKCSEQLNGLTEVSTVNPVAS